MLQSLFTKEVQAGSYRGIWTDIPWCPKGSTLVAGMCYLGIFVAKTCCQDAPRILKDPVLGSACVGPARGEPRVLAVGRLVLAGPVMSSTCSRMPKPKSSSRARFGQQADLGYFAFAIVVPVHDSLT